MVVRARDVMTSRVVSVQPDTAIDRARYLLTENRFSALPVVDGRYRVVGIVTTLDLLRAARSSPETVAEIMTRNPLTMASDAPVSIIAHRLRHYGELRAMPIVESGQLAGIVTRADLLETGRTGGLFGRFRRRETPPPLRRGDGETRTGPTVAEVMTPGDQVYDVIESTGVAVAAQLLRDHRFTALPVTDAAGCVVGIVSEADLIPDRLSGRRTPPARTVGGAMTAGPQCARLSDSVGDVARSMIAHGYRLLPVVNDDGILVGVVSRGDLLRAMES